MSITVNFKALSLQTIAVWDDCFEALIISRYFRHPQRSFSKKLFNYLPAL